MPLQEWPSGLNYMPKEGSWAMQPYLAPLRTEMDGGNLRERARPGDEVRVIQQTLAIDANDYEATLEPFLLANRGQRVVMPVWLGTEYHDCVVQILDPQISWPRHGVVEVGMTVRVISKIEA